jgi:hypothetical protein
VSEETAVTDHSRSQRSLSLWQRLLLGLGALAFGGLGVLAIFTTENEAGTAVALLGCGVLLLIAVQGTMVQRISAGDKSIELAEVRRSIAEQAKAEAADNPEAAIELIQSYEMADPRSQADPSISSAKASIYDSQVIGAVMMEMTEISPEAQVLDGGVAGALLRYEVDERVVIVEAKYRLPHRRLYLSDIRRARSVLAANRAAGALVVSNVGMTADARDLLNESAPPIEVVVWDPVAGNGPVRTGLHRLFNIVNNARD